MTGSAEMPYAFRPVGISDPDLHRLADFLAGVFDRKDLYVPRYLRWLYRENPAGPVIGVNAWDGEELAGHYAVIPICAESGEGRYRAALSLNTATHPAHQGRGLFTRLAEETYALASDAGVREIVGIANANSAPGFVRRLGFQDCGPLEARLLWRPPQLADGERAVSWRRVWDAESLRWRARNPQARYALEARGGIRAILGSTGWPGIHAVLRMEPTAGAVELPDLELAQRAPLRLWLGRSARVTQPWAGGVSIPMRMRPSPLQVIHRSLIGRGPIREPERMHVEAFDFDAY